jgi:hypothetical protein
VYKIAFDLPAAVSGGAEKGKGSRGAVRIDLGRVKNIARVTLNGKDAGVVWCSPWNVDVTGALKEKGNELEVKIANLWPNRLIGDEKLPPAGEYGKNGNLVRWPDWILQKNPTLPAGRHTFATWRHYSKDSPLLPSGLLGPVSLLMERR